MKQAFSDHIRKYCSSNEKFLLAVSGGIDSMALLHLFQACKLNIGVAHVNFQLRGSESDGDEAFVKDYCVQHAIPYFSTRFETAAFAKENHLSIQMAARQLRYQWFDELLTNQGYDFLATAHHLNDSIETALLNMVRGAGLEGWDGIADRNGKIIRPLLFATREEIEKYVKEKEFLWREDKSNSGDDYPRNFIRHHVIPKLKELNPSLENSFQDAEKKIAGAVALMEFGIKSWREKFEHKKGGLILLNKQGFREFHDVGDVIWNLIKGYGFHQDQCRQIAEVIDGQPGKHFYAGGFALVVDRDNLIISKVGIPFGDVWIESGETEVGHGNQILQLAETEQPEIAHDNTIAQLDAAKLRFPLHWRKWQPGDYFYPLGMQHRKKVSDFLVDQKVSVADKENVTVLLSENEIVWIVGHRIDDRFKVTATTKSTLTCDLLNVDR